MISNPDLFLRGVRRTPARIRFWSTGKGTSICIAPCRAFKALGKRAGVAINPATPAGVLEEILPDVDQVLVMTVDPGFGHQHFLHSTLAKISRVRQMIDRVKPECDLEVDGGIDSDNGEARVEAGANVLVAGSSVFGTQEGSVP